MSARGATSALCAAQSSTAGLLPRSRSNRADRNRMRVPSPHTDLGGPYVAPGNDVQN